MSQNTTPCKEIIRDWLRQRRLSAAPPPSIAQIQQAIGWGAPAPGAVGCTGQPAVPAPRHEHG